MTMVILGYQGIPPLSETPIWSNKPKNSGTVVSLTEGSTSRKTMVVVTKHGMENWVPIFDPW
jgi:hypothetical protein